MSISTLSVPLKKSADHLDWIKPLSKYIESEYSKQDAVAHAASIAEFQHLRTDVEKTTERGAAAQATFLKYFERMCVLHSRFPIDESHLKVFFSWKDAWTGSKMGQFYAPVELSSVLFNYGAACSHIAKQEALKVGGDGLGLKVAAHEFQRAAGVFRYIRTDLGQQLVQGSTVDLSSSCLDALEKLMLAQAQECFVSRAICDGKSDAIVVMLACQAAMEFDGVAAVLDSDRTLSGAWGKEWTSHIKCKALLFHSLAQYRSSLCALESCDYGIQVARLDLAKMLIEQAKVVAQKSVRELSGFIDAHAGTVAGALAGAVRDNDTVYHEPVPQRSDLAPLARKSLVRPTPMHMRIGSDPDNGPELTSALEYGSALVSTPADVFRDLAPLAVHVALSEYIAQRDTVVSNIGSEMQEHTSLCDGALASLGLPASIEALESPMDGLPRPLKEKVAEARRVTGGLTVLSSKMESLRETSKASQARLEAAAQALASEQRDDSQMRERFGSRWRIVPSADLNGAMKAEVERYSGHLKNAQRSDDVLADRLKSRAQLWRMLDRTPAELDALMPVTTRTATTATASGVSSNANEANAVSALKSTLNRTASMKSARTALMGDLRAAVAQDNVMGALMAAHKKLDDPTEKRAIFTRELGKFDPFRRRLADSLEEQRSLLESLADQNAVFERSQAQDETSKRRKEVLQDLEVAVTGAVGFLKNLDEGARFYSDFDSRIESVRRKADDFVVARRMQRQDVLSELTGSGSGSESAASLTRPAPEGFSASQSGAGATPAPYTPSAAATATSSGVIIRCYKCSTTLQAPVGAPLVQCPACKSVNQVAV